jgi:glycosyltransferase involved in cell wall biosynthesis
MLRNPRLLLAGSLLTQKARRHEIVHHTYYHPRFLGAFRVPRVVSTIHDMIPEHFPEQFPLGNPHQAKDRYVKSSDALICVSECTKRDVADHYRIPLERMRVIPLAPASQFYEVPEGSISPLPIPYVLYVGQRGGYKNFKALVSAVANSKVLRDVRVVTAGGPPLSDDENQELDSHQMRSRIIHLQPSDDELRRLYTHAIAFVCPSLYEGFGLPVLEAMAANCPVIAADRASLPEVVGDGGLLFDASSSEQLMTLIEDLATNEELATQLRHRGRERAAAFSWKRTAQLTADLYGDLS